MTCKCFGDRSKSDYCDFCDKLYFKEKELKSFRRELPKKEVKKLTEKPCKKCQKVYMPTSFRQIYCSNECRPQFKTEAEKWLSKKGPSNNGVNSNRIAYGLFRKKYGISKIYSVCRG